MDKIRSFVKKNNTICLVIGLFLLFLLIQVRYMYVVRFDPDELDIYVNGFEMVNGKILYKDIPSQHMPWTYIISSFFYLIGAHSVPMQRLCFYILFAGFWTSFVFVYKDYVNKWILILQALLYHMILQHLDFATQILSEHLSVIGAQIFLLEFLMFIKKRDISIGSCIRMSIAVVMTFGAAFITIFSLFFIAVGVFALEIKWGIEEHEKASHWWKKMFIRYGRLVGIVAVPWIGMICYMIATHSLGDFWLGAYTVNREYYPRYMEGLGGGIASTFITSFNQLAKYLMSLSLGGLNLMIIIQLFMIGCGLYFVYKIGRKEGFIVGFTLFLYIFTYGSRGFFNYHGATFVGVIALVTAYVMVNYLYCKPKEFDSKPLFYKASICSLTTALIIMYCMNITMMLSFIKGIETNEYQNDTELVELLTDEDERVWQTNVNNSICWFSKRVSSGPTVSTPWMWDAIGHKGIDEAIKNPPRVAIFQIGYESWGHNMADYAPEAYYFIVNNYKHLPTSDMIWVHKDYYNDACFLLGIDPDTPDDSGVGTTPFTVDDSELPGKTPEDRQYELEHPKEDSGN